MCYLVVITNLKKNKIIKYQEIHPNQNKGTMEGS